MIMRLKLFFLLSFCALLLSGCVAAIRTTTSPKFEIGRTTVVHNYRIIQTIDSHLALASDNDIVSNPVVIAIRSSNMTLYDELKINGSFVMIDTYTYTTYPDAQGRIFQKTVPLVIPRDEYYGKTVKTGE